MHAHSLKHGNNEEKKLVLRKALLRMAERLTLSRRELATILGLSEASLSRLYDGKRFIEPRSKEGELAAMLLRLYRSLDSLFGGNEQQCQLWLRSENTHLNSTPIQLIQTIQGLLTTITYLDAMRGRN
jgi:transcriptional regulator with XRE-family HTH domain